MATATPCILRQSHAQCRVRQQLVKCNMLQRQRRLTSLPPPTCPRRISQHRRMRHSHRASQRVSRRVRIPGWRPPLHVRRQTMRTAQPRRTAPNRVATQAARMRTDRATDARMATLAEALTPLLPPPAVTRHIRRLRPACRPLRTTPTVQCRATECTARRPRCRTTPLRRPVTRVGLHITRRLAAADTAVEVRVVHHTPRTAAVVHTRGNLEAC